MADGSAVYDRVKFHHPKAKAATWWIAHTCPDCGCYYEVRGLLDAPCPRCNPLPPIVNRDTGDEQPNRQAA